MNGEKSFWAAQHHVIDAEVNAEIVIPLFDFNSCSSWGLDTPPSVGKTSSDMAAFRRGNTKPGVKQLIICLNQMEMDSTVIISEPVVFRHRLVARNRVS